LLAVYLTTLGQKEEKCIKTTSAAKEIYIKNLKSLYCFSSRLFLAEKKFCCGRIEEVGRNDAINLN
jgi:hypothetical protein